MNNNLNNDNSFKENINKDNNIDKENNNTNNTNRSVDNNNNNNDNVSDVNNEKSVYNNKNKDNNNIEVNEDIESDDYSNLIGGATISSSKSVRFLTTSLSFLNTNKKHTQAIHSFIHRYNYLEIPYLKALLESGRCIKYYDMVKDYDVDFVDDFYLDEKTRFDQFTESEFAQKYKDKIDVREHFLEFFNLIDEYIDSFYKYWLELEIDEIINLEWFNASNNIMFSSLIKTLLSDNYIPSKDHVRTIRSLYVINNNKSKKDVIRYFSVAEIIRIGTNASQLIPMNFVVTLGEIFGYSINFDEYGYLYNYREVLNDE